MLVTTVRPKPLGLALRAWSSLLDAVRVTLPLFLIGYLLLAGLDIAVHRLSALAAIPSTDTLKEIIKDNRRLPWLGIWQAIGLDFLTCFLRAIILAPLALAMHRYILLGEVRRFSILPKPRFALWIFLLQLPVLVLWWLIIFGRGATGLVPLLYVLLIVLSLFLMQTLQLFPGLALEERSRDLSERLETALERSEGLFWLTFIATVLAFLPVAVAQLVAVRVSPKLVAQAPLIVPIAKAGLEWIGVSLLAALASWLFSYGAHKKPASQPAPPSAYRA